MIGGVSDRGGRPIASPLVPPRELPADTAYFTGRRPELTQLLATCREAAEGGKTAGVTVIVAVNGMAGVGKTTLAVHAAHRLADRFPDGCLFLDLHGHTPSIDPVKPDTALERLLRTLGVLGEQIPHQLDAKAALYRSRVANTRTLLVLDNAHSVEQIRPLLPAAPRCLVMVTSRQRLTALDEALPLSLEALPMADGLAMFAEIAGADRVAGESEAGAAERVVELCGRLPLAIRIAVARLRARPLWTIAHLADRLTDQRGALAELDDGERSVAAAFAVSYHDLTGAQQRTFRALGLHPGIETDCPAAAALTRATLDQAGQLCEDLVDANLLIQPAPGRYRFHDLVRAYASKTAAIQDSAQERHAALTALFDHYLSMTARTMDALYPTETDLRPPIGSAKSPAPAVADPEAARTWLNTELPNLVSVCAHSAAHGWLTHTTRLAAILFRYLDLGSHVTEAAAIHTCACRAARDSGDRSGEAHD
ncbi:MAG: ATP-binding protein [Pseudonocardiaceae bacterium]